MRFGRIVLVCVVLCVLVSLCESKKPKSSKSKPKDKPPSQPSSRYRTKNHHGDSDSSSSEEETGKSRNNNRKISKHQHRGSKEAHGAHRETINAFLDAEKKHERHKLDKPNEKLSKNRKWNSTLSLANATTNSKKWNATLTHTNATSQSKRLNATLTHTNATSQSKRLNATLTHTNATSQNKKVNATLAHTNVTSHSKRLNATLTHRNATSHSNRLNATLTHLNSSSHESLKLGKSENISSNIINTDNKKLNTTLKFKHGNRKQANSTKSQNSSGLNFNQQSNHKNLSSSDAAPPVGWIVDQRKNTSHLNSSNLSNTSRPSNGLNISLPQDGRMPAISHTFQRPHSLSPVPGNSQYFNSNSSTNVKTFSNIGWIYNQTQNANIGKPKEIISYQLAPSPQIGWSHNLPYNQPTFTHYGNYDPGFSHYVKKKKKKKNKKNKFKLDLSLEDTSLEDVNWSEVIKDGAKIHAKLKELLAAKKITKLPSRGLYSELFPKVNQTLPPSIIGEIPKIGIKETKLYTYNVSSPRVFAGLTSDISSGFKKRRRRELSPQGQAMADAINKFLLSERDCNETLDARRKRELADEPNSMSENHKEVRAENESILQNTLFNGVEAIVRNKFGVAIYDHEPEKMTTILNDKTRKKIDESSSKHAKHITVVYRSAYNYKDSGPLAERRIYKDDTSLHLSANTQYETEGEENTEGTEVVSAQETLDEFMSRKRTTHPLSKESQEFSSITNKLQPLYDSAVEYIDRSQINSELGSTKSTNFIDDDMLLEERGRIVQFVRSGSSQSEIQFDHSRDNVTNGSRYLYSVLPESNYITESENVNTERSPQGTLKKDNYAQYNINGTNYTSLLFETRGSQSSEMFEENLKNKGTLQSTVTNSTEFPVDSFETMKTYQDLVNQTTSHPAKTIVSETTSRGRRNDEKTAASPGKDTLRSFKTLPDVLNSSEVIQLGKELPITTQMHVVSDKHMLSFLTKRTPIDVGYTNQEADTQTEPLPIRPTVDNDHFEHIVTRDVHTTEVNDDNSDLEWYTSTSSYDPPYNSQTTRGTAQSSIHIHAVHHVGMKLPPIIPKMMLSRNTPEPVSQGGLIIQAPPRKINCPRGTKAHRGRCRAVWS